MTSTVTFKGKPITVNGTLPKKGDKAAPFTLTNVELTDVSLDEFKGKRKVLNIFPSVDTSVCAITVRRFNELAADMTNSVVLCISADLPFAQARFCGSEGIKNVVMLSLFRNKTFKKDYGVDIASGPVAGLAARAVIILDENNQIIYSQLVDEISKEPDYEAALAALK